MADELSEREQALRRLPLPYSLALRLRDAGVAADVICQYVNVERAALDGLYRIAERNSLRRKNNTPPLPQATDAADCTTFESRGQARRRFKRGRRLAPAVWAWDKRELKTATK